MRIKKAVMCFLVICVLITPSFYCYASAHIDTEPAEVKATQMYPDVHDLVDDDYKYFLVTSANFGWVVPGSTSRWLDTSKYRYIAYVSTSPSAYDHWVYSDGAYKLYGFDENSPVSDGWTLITETEGWNYQQVVNGEFNNSDYMLSANYESGSDELAITVTDSSKVDLNGYGVGWLSQIKTISHWLLHTCFVPFFQVVISDSVFLTLFIVLGSFSVCCIVVSILRRLRERRRKKR